MSEHPTTLKDSGGDRVEAVLHDEVDLDALFDAEASWAEPRARILQTFTKRGAHKPPQTVHWTWAQKAFSLSRRQLAPGPLSIVRVFGIKRDEAWQGMMLAFSEGYRVRVGTPGRDLVYVEYLESAPWNWELPEIGQVGKFRGVGPQLLAMATLWSQQLGMKGRVGLHGISQAESFYRGRCQMTDLGMEKAPGALKGLTYFEFTEVQANEFLERSVQP